MDDKTLKAIIGSVFKWDSIAFGYGEDLGGDNCELCKTFDCTKCPYYNGYNDCGPAYAIWRDLRDFGPSILSKATTKKEIHAAKQVWLELLSLLPQEEY